MPPKRGVGGSNPLVDAKNSAESLVKSSLSGYKEVYSD